MAERMSRLELEAGAKVLQALSHPVRLGVLQQLVDGEQSVSALYRELDCSQSMMSQQLGILERQGLIKTRKEGTIKYCSLGNPDFLNLFHCLRGHLHEVLRIQS